MGIGFSFFAYGTQSRVADFSFLEHFLSTSVFYAMPAMLAMVEGTIRNADLFSIALAVFIINIRLIPMTMAIVPSIRSKSEWKNILSIHFVAMTTWITYLKWHLDIDKKRKTKFYFSLAVALWVIANAMGAMGYFVAGLVGQKLLTAFIFSNPLYFLCLLLEQTKKKDIFLAIGLGSILMPISYYFFPDAAVLITGFMGGTLAFLISRG